MILIVSHAGYHNGYYSEFPTSTLKEILNNKKQEFLYIRHSLRGNFVSTLQEFEKGVVSKEQNLFNIPKPSPLRYIIEIVVNFFTINKLASQHKNLNVIAVDPLNAFACVFLRRMDKIKSLVFYTADYAEDRFKNKILNSIYHWIDRYCIKYADATWNVSSRIVNKRKELGLDDQQNLFVPNVPAINGDFVSGKAERHKALITLGYLDSQMDYCGIIDAVDELCERGEELKLIIVGTGPLENDYIQYAKSKKNCSGIIFTGAMDHDVALEHISMSHIGLALYNGEWSFNYYGDSMKCREYMAFGLPIITTDTHSTVDEIRNNKAGIVCAMDKQSYINAIREILSKYEFYSQNSAKLGKKYKGIHERLLEEIQ